MWKQFPLRIFHWNAKSYTLSHWYANTCAALHNSGTEPRKPNRLLQLLRTTHNQNNRSLKAENTFGPALVDRQEPKKPPIYEAWSYPQQFYGQDTTGSVNGNPTQNPNQVQIQRRFKPNIYPQTADPMWLLVLTTSLSHNNFPEGQRLRGPLWRKSPPIAAIAQQQETLLSQQWLDRLLIMTNSYKRSVRPRRPQKRYVLSSNARTIPTNTFCCCYRSISLVHCQNQWINPTSMTNFPIIQPLPKMIAAIKENSEEGSWF